VAVLMGIGVARSYRDKLKQFLADVAGDDSRMVSRGSSMGAFGTGSVGGGSFGSAAALGAFRSPSTVKAD
jgi:hypothetical protein